MNTWTFLIFSLTFLCNASANVKPAIAVIIADWGMNEMLHNTLEPQIPSTFTLALHIMGKKTVATGQRSLLVHVPTIHEFQHAAIYAKKCSNNMQNRMQGVWIEVHNGESPYPTSSRVGAYNVFSQPPLSPLPEPESLNTLVGQFWVSPSLPTSERQKIYNMALGYATQSKDQACMLSVNFSTIEAWDDFQKWYKANEQKVQWITIQEYAVCTKSKKPTHG